MKPQEINASEFSSSMITRITNRVFVGLQLCRSEDWLSNSHAYPMSAIALGRALWKYPACLRHVVHPFMKETAALNKAKQAISDQLLPVIAARRYGNFDEKPNDMLQWMLDTAKGPDAQDDEIVKKFMVLTLAAVYTSGMTLVHLLYDMCSRPEWIPILRDDVQASLAAENGVWSTQTLLRMRKLDSFLKESFNHNQPSSRKFAL
jgi:ent-kaurene oxidase